MLVDSGNNDNYSFSMKKILFSLMMCASLAWLVALPVHAQSDTPAVEQKTLDAKAAIKRWETVFQAAESYLGDQRFDEVQSEDLYNQLNRIRSEALNFKNITDKQYQAIANLLEALGEKPAENEQPESQTISEKRSKYNDELSQKREQLAQIDLALVRVDELADGLSTLRRGLMVQEIFTRYPPPVDVQTLAIALPEVLKHIQSLVLAPGDWFESLSAEDRQRLAVWPTILVTVLSLLLGIFLRSWILQRYGRDESTENPPLTMKITAAIADGVARGLVPLLTLIGLGLWISQHTVVTEGLFAEMLKAGFGASVYFVALGTLANAVLSPEHPGWRLIDLSPVATRIVGYATLLLIAVVAIDMFIVEATRSLALSLSMQSTYISLLILIKAMLIILISLPRWWVAQGSEENRAETEIGVMPAPRPTIYVDYLRRLIIVVAFVAILASFAGYANLAMYLVENLIDSAVYILLFMGLRAVLLEILTAITRSRLLRQQAGLKLITLKHIKLWGGGLITAALVIIVALKLVLIWGVSEEDLSRWIGSLLTGMKVGSITISLSDIAIAIFVFIAVMALTRLIQRALLSSILPQFTANRAVQHSLSSGTGYIGIVVAIMMFVAALGINLESIALVAGALSVGIGFGLQNIVNNFVSGLILILERPIKVGDWVVVGQHEGFVQQINFRATELETFTRASVIIPNSEMLSNSVTNLTYHDKTSRVELPLQVAYGTDPNVVIGILETVAREQDEVLNYPKAFVLLTGFGADGLDFELRCFIRDATMKLTVASNIRLRLLEKLNEAGIEIPFPQRVLHMAATDNKVAQDSSPQVGGELPGSA
ncbi:MAG: mechanosensitive ion channel family protein [Gammaproteobacteria bacterium]|nr:mechanosensitive ion channel family protein [Gammaproteobacteria bacterium]